MLHFFADALGKYTRISSMVAPYENRCGISGKLQHSPELAGEARPDAEPGTRAGTAPHGFSRKSHPKSLTILVAIGQHQA